MKSILTKLAVFFTTIFIIGVFTSCVYEETVYVDCDAAYITIVNSSTSLIYYSLEGDYCYPEDYLYPDESLTIPYGQVHWNMDLVPEYYTFYYRYNSSGEPIYALDKDIVTCDNVEYID